MSSPDLSKLLRTSVKPVYKCYLWTGSTELLTNFGKSDDDIIYFKMLISPRCICGLMLNFQNFFEWYLVLVLPKRSLIFLWLLHPAFAEWCMPSFIYSWSTGYSQNMNFTDWDNEAIRFSYLHGQNPPKIRFSILVGTS